LLPIGRSGELRRARSTDGSWPPAAGLASRLRTFSTKTREASVKVACDPELSLPNGRYRAPRVTRTA
jgi:hypothetical protein